MALRCRPLTPYSTLELRMLGMIDCRISVLALVLARSFLDVARNSLYFSNFSFLPHPNVLLYKVDMEQIMELIM